jgi:diguanylate cyclase (GGDEF)-like protein
MQLSSKIAISISLVALAAGAAATAIALEQQERERREAFEVESQAAVELLAASITPVVAERRHHRAQAVLDAVGNFPERYPRIQSVEVLDEHKRVIAHLDPTRFNTVVDDEDADRDLALLGPAAHWVDDNELHVAVPLKATHHLGVMRVKLNATKLTSSIERQKRAAAIFVLGTLAVIALALHLVIRRLVAQRLSGLTRAAGALGKGRMDVRADDAGKDEIAELGASFNSMANAIRLYTEDLEHIIAERTEELEQANQELERLAITDQLTGLHNRRHFDENARRSLELARRNERPLSVVLVDTDRFKSVNDRFGHPVGDEVLKAVAGVLKQNARKADLVARIGGEEFAILMPDAQASLAAQAAERMREALEAEVSPQVSALKGERVTASFGVAAWEKASDRLEDLLSAADAALYRSKEQGRNRVTVAEPPPLDPSLLVQAKTSEM